MESIVKFAKQNENFRIPRSLQREMVSAGFSPEKHFQKINQEKIKDYLVQGGSTSDTIKILLPLVLLLVVVVMYLKTRNSQQTTDFLKEDGSLKDFVFTQNVTKIYSTHYDDLKMNPSLREQSEEYDKKLEVVDATREKCRGESYVADLLDTKNVVLTKEDINYLSSLKIAAFTEDVGQFRKMVKYWQVNPTKAPKDVLLEELCNRFLGMWHREYFADREYKKYINMPMPRYKEEEKYPPYLHSMAAAAKTIEEFRFITLKYTVSQDELLFYQMLEKIEEIKKTPHSEMHDKKIKEVVARFSQRVYDYQVEKEELARLTEQIYKLRKIKSGMFSSKWLPF